MKEFQKLERRRGERMQKKNNKVEKSERRGSEQGL
jgi:hypothetical protein